MRAIPNLRIAIAALAVAISPAIAQTDTPPFRPSAVTPATSDSARNVLERVRPSVIQIKGFFGANTAQAFHGTGFAVKPGGIFMTNYHVVSQHVQHPKKYRLEYKTPDGQTGPVAVLAIDVRRDLAIVRATGHEPEPIRLRDTPPVKGDRAFSVGFPLDVGLTITEGVSNGMVEESFEPRIHYSGAINAGMSGGPALDGSGEVIGINVSGYRFEQLVSFLVPVSHARSFIDRLSGEGSSPEALKDDLAAQVRAHSGDLLGALAGPLTTQTTAGYKLPAKIAPFIACTASGNPSSSDPVQATHTNCSAKAGLYLQQGLYGGDIRFSHHVLTTETLDSWRFANRLASQAVATGAFGSWRHVGPYACEDRVVALDGFDADVLICARSYRKLDGLYDFTVRVNSLNSSKAGFASHLDLYTLEYEPAMKFIERFIRAMEWRP